MIWKVSLVLGLALCVSCSKRPAVSEQKVKQIFTGHHGELRHVGQHAPERHEVYAWAYPWYEFSYYVDDPHTHDMKGQQEIRDGDKVTGDYWLIQPDGLKRTVKYHSDHKNGFNAEVNYLPHGHHLYEVREHHENHAPNEKVKELIHKVAEIKKDRDDDERTSNVHDRHNDWGRRNYDEHGHRDNQNRDHDHRRKEGWDERRDDRREERRSNDRRQHEDHRWVEDHKDRNYDKHSDEVIGRRNEHGHEEHWKNGVLVGWTEGRGRGHRRGDERRGRNDDHSQEDRHDHISSRASVNFKPLIPYGHRLH